MSGEDGFHEDHWCKPFPSWEIDTDHLPALDPANASFRIPLSPFCLLLLSPRADEVVFSPSQ